MEQRWGWDSSGWGEGIRKPTEFVISRVMQDAWQLVRVLTVLSIAWLPSWQVVICALEGFYWLPLTPWWGLWGFISGAQQWGTPKLLVLITQKDSLPYSCMWSPLGSQQAWVKMKACLLFLLRMCSAHASSADECPLLFCTGPHTHTHTRT